MKAWRGGAEGEGDGGEVEERRGGETEESGSRRGRGWRRAEEKGKEKTEEA